MILGTQSVTRKQLYDLVWAEPMKKVAEYFNVSSSYLARVCMKLDIPRPQRGYWAKLAVDKKVDQPPLPHLQPFNDHCQSHLLSHKERNVLKLPKIKIIFPNSVFAVRS